MTFVESLPGLEAPMIGDAGVERLLAGGALGKALDAAMKAIDLASEGLLRNPTA